MSESRTFVLQCEDGYKATLTVAMVEGRIAISSYPQVVDPAHLETYDTWLHETVVPALLDWFPPDVKLAFAMLGAKIKGVDLTGLLDSADDATNELDNEAQDDEDSAHE